MNYAEMTNAELRERVELLKELRELEAAASKPEAHVDTPWYPEMHKDKWVEHAPGNPVDRSRVADILYAKERSTQAFVPGSI